MKYGAFALIWVPSFTERALYLFDKVRNMGFEGIEISLSQSFLKSGPIMGIKRKSKQTGVKCVISTGLDEEHNIIDSEKSTRKRGVNYLKRCVEIASELNSDVLSGVIYAPWGKFTGLARTSEEWEYCKEGLWKVAEFAKEGGVYLAIDPVNRFESFFLNTASEAQKLIKEIGHPNIKMHLDTFQMNIEENNMYEAIKTAGDLLYHFHCCASHRGIPGTGHIEWDEVFEALKEVNYQRWLVIESFTPDIMKKEFGKQVAIWRRIASPDEIASEGLKFLKKCEEPIQPK